MLSRILQGLKKLTGAAPADEPKLTIGTMINKFTDLFGLPKGNYATAHDAVHAMTGIGIGIAEELRIIAVNTALSDKFNTASVRDVRISIHESMKWSMEDLHSPNPSISVTNGLENDVFVRQQRKVVPISDAEVKALFDLGRKMQEEIFKLTGKKYVALNNRDIKALDFSKVDFSGEVLAIRKQHERPENRAIAIAIAKAMRDAGKKQGKGLQVPRAGSTWVARVKREF